MPTGQIFLCIHIHQYAERTFVVLVLTSFFFLTALGRADSRIFFAFVAIKKRASRTQNHNNHRRATPSHLNSLVDPINLHAISYIAVEGSSSSSKRRDGGHRVQNKTKDVENFWSTFHSIVVIVMMTAWKISWGATLIFFFFFFSRKTLEPTFNWKSLPYF